MKKQLMAAALFAALGLSSCSHDFEYSTVTEAITDTYNTAFVETFGQPAATQDWGFGSTDDEALARTRSVATRGVESGITIGQTVQTTNSLLGFDGWNDQKTYITVEPSVNQTSRLRYLATGDETLELTTIPEVFKEICPEGSDNRSAVASTNKQEFVTTAAGEISFINVSALAGFSADKSDRVGYYYYTTSGNIKTLHKYVLSNAPSIDLTSQGGVDLGYENDVYLGWQESFTYKSFRLVYVDEAGNASYTFPAGVNVGFFTETKEWHSNGVELYSNGQFNENLSNWIENSLPGEHQWAATATASHVSLFSYKGYNFVGFEDWTDYDYNDIVLSVYGNIKEAETVHNDGEEVVEETWGTPVRVIAEDLSVKQRTDFDFNDVVFDVALNDTKTKAKITLKAAGGTLPLTVGWSGEDGTNYLDYEVHELYGVSVGTMVNTNASNGIDNKADVTYILTGSFRNANDVKVMVQKQGQWIELTAHQGEPASKIAVGTDYEWCDERENITDRYSNFSTYVQEPTLTQWWRAQ